MQEGSGDSAGVGHSLDVPEVLGMRAFIIIRGFWVRAKHVDPDAVLGKWCLNFHLSQCYTLFYFRGQLVYPTEPVGRGNYLSL